MRTYVQVTAAIVLSILIAVSLPAVGQRPVVANTIESKFATVDGIKLHYLTAGHGPAVILLHGYTQTSRMWRPISTDSIN